MQGGGNLTVELVVAGVGLALLAWRGAEGVRAGRDARQHGWSRVASAGWAMSAMAYRGWYWRRGRLGRLGWEEAQEVLRSAAREHGLTRVGNIRCPLCEAEIEAALGVTADGRLAIQDGSKCPRCDFRLDACRHCQHFLPAKDATGGEYDMTNGRCGAYRATQPVGEVYPDMERQLGKMGYDTLYAPKRIMDSYVPLEECRRFRLHSARLRMSKIDWLSGERMALIRLRQRLKIG